MSVQTPIRVSLLSKILGFIEVAAAVGMEVPEAHVQAISLLIEELTQQVAGGEQAIQTAVTSLGNAAVSGIPAPTPIAVGIPPVPLPVASAAPPPNTTAPAGS